MYGDTVRKKSARSDRKQNLNLTSDLVRGSPLWARWAAGPPIEPAVMPATAPTWQLWPASDESDSEEEDETVDLPAVDCGPFQLWVRRQAGPPIEQAELVGDSGRQCVRD